MDGAALKDARSANGWTQAEAAARLGVTQAYLSMLERAERKMPKDLAARAVKAMKARPTALPFSAGSGSPCHTELLTTELGRLGYPGFAYMRGFPRMNPAELLMNALDQADLNARVTEALPWLLLEFPEMDLDWLLRQARLRDRQNRLGYTLELARQAAAKLGDAQLQSQMTQRLAMLEPGRLANEGTYCRDGMTQAERSWLRRHRPKAAEHWNLLTDLTVEQLNYVTQGTTA